MNRSRAKLAIMMAVAIAGAGLAIPAWVLASCGSLAGVRLPVGELRYEVSLFNTAYANAYYGGSNHELNIGANHQVGWLAQDQFYDLYFAGAVTDRTLGCAAVTLRGRTSAWQGSACNGERAGGDWTADYVVNTCAQPDSFFQAQTNIRFFQFGDAPSIRTTAEIFNDQGQVIAQDSGCFAISTSPGGCTN